MPRVVPQSTMSRPLTVLMVAEKPSIAQAVANALASGAQPPSQVNKRRGVSPSAPVFEYDGVFAGTKARFKVTSTVGHVWSLDFPKEYNDQVKIDPVELFDAPTQHMEDPRPRMSEHLSREAVDADALVLWLDCDREGENICFEVMAITQPVLNPLDLGGYEGNVFRARFSSLAPADLQNAMGALAFPNKVGRVEHPPVIGTERSGRYTPSPLAGGDPLLYTAVTPPLHRCCTAVTSPLHHRCTACPSQAESLSADARRYIPVTPPLHHHYIPVT